MLFILSTVKLNSHSNLKFLSLAAALLDLNQPSSIDLNLLNLFGIKNKIIT